MFTRRTHLGRLLSVVHIAAVPAFPVDLLVPLEHGALLHVAQQLPVPLLVLLLHLAYLGERLRHLVETLLPSRLGEVRVKGPPLQLLAFRGRQQVLCRGPDLPGGVGGRNLYITTLQVLEEHLGVLHLILSRFYEECRELLAA